MATAGESSPVSKATKPVQKSFATGGGNHARFMLGFEDVQGGTAEGVRPAGGRDLLAMFLSDDGSVKLISLRSLVGTEDLPVIELSELQKRVKQLLGIVG